MPRHRSQLTDAVPPTAVRPLTSSSGCSHRPKNNKGRILWAAPPLASVYVPKIGRLPSCASVHGATPSSDTNKPRSVPACSFDAGPACRNLRWPGALNPHKHTQAAASTPQF